MTNNDVERLAWERVDGTISAEDDARLDEMLGADEVARRRLASIETMAGRLAGVGSMPPPAALRPRIERALTASSPRWRRRAEPARIWSMRLGYLAAGIMLGLVAARLLIPTVEVSRRDVAGAMVAPQTATTIDVERAGTLAIWSAGDSLIAVELSLSSATNVQVTLDAGPGDLRIVQAGLGGVAMGEASSDGERVRMVARGPGRCSMTLGVDRVDPAITVGVSSDGRTVATQLIRPGEDGGGR